MGLGFAGGKAFDAYQHNQAATEANASIPSKKAVEAVESGAASGNTSVPEGEPGQPRPVTPRGGLNPQELANIKIFEQSAPSVVYITTTVVEQDYWTFNAYERESGSGSGFIWDRSGHIVTNYHVIKGANKARVTLADQSNWDASVVGIYPEKDIAVLKIKAGNGKLPPIPVGTSSDLKVGQQVYAIGNPFGLDQTLTTGIVSALGREITSVAGVQIRDVIQSDAAINPGNSGGPLLDSEGRLIGINTAIYSPSGASAGIGFSIPVDAVNWIVPEIIRFGKVQRPVIGIEPIPERMVRGIKGLAIYTVTERSPASRAGLRGVRRNQYGEFVLGDVIVGINNDKIENQSDYVLAMEKYRPGDTVTVRFSRGGKEEQVVIKLEAP